VGGAGAMAFYLGLKRIAAQRAAVLTYLEPLVAALVGALAFGERLSVAALAGGALIVLGGADVVTERIDTNAAHAYAK